MKKVLLAAIALMSVSFAKAQDISLLTFQSYTFQDRIRWEWGDGLIQDGFQWGGGLEIGLTDQEAIEIIYQNLKTNILLNDYSGIVAETVIEEATFHYILVGGTHYEPFTDVLSGFGSLDAGLTIASPTDPDYSNVTKFTWAGRLGLRIMPSDRLSFRIHGQLTSPVQAFGGGLYFGTGGSGVSTSTFSTIWQFNIGSSINIKLN